MSVDRSITQRSHLYFALFFLLMLAAFWRTYFTRLFDQESFRMHLHGMTLLTWCTLLVLQPYLIRTRRTLWHRRLGKLSYGVVPLLMFTTYDLLRYRMHKQGAVDPAAVALVINALVAFLLFYALAIYFRKEMPLHARFMVCTVFPMFTPVTDRIINIYFPSTLSSFPTLMGYPNVPLFGFVLADLILIGLSVWDWRAHRRLVFPFALIVLLLYHASFNFLYAYPFWQNFSNWLMQ